MWVRFPHLAPLKMIPKVRAKFKREIDYLRYCARQRKRVRIRAKLNYDDDRYLGICNKCGLKCSINPKTEYYFWLCDNHLAKQRIAEKMKRRARKADKFIKEMRKLGRMSTDNSTAERMNKSSEIGRRHSILTRTKEDYGNNIKELP